MINSVVINSALTSTNATQRQPPPPVRDVFKVADSDSNGQVSATELETLAAGIEEITGNSIDVEESLATYDADGDGALSGEELYGLMSSQGFNPGAMFTSEDDGMMPPPPPPAEQVLSAYGQNSGEDTTGNLIELLRNGSDSEEQYSSVAISA